MYSTARLNHNAIPVNVYASNKEKPMYVDDDGCVLIGKANIDIPLPFEEEHSVSVEYIFGNTEISMTATDKVHGTTREATYQLV